MHLRGTRALPILLAALFSAPLFAQDATDLLDRLGSDNGDERREAAQALAPFGAEVIGPLFELMGDEDKRLDLAARLATQAVVQHAASPEGSALRVPVAEALAAEALSDRPHQTRVFAVRMISFAGDDEVVPAMTALLGDPKMHEIARWALARMPGPAAVEALTNALDFAQPDQAVGLLNALAVHASRDMHDIATSALEHSNENVRLAGLNLLAAIPDVAGAEIIRELMVSEGQRQRAAARDAYLRLADTLLRNGKQSAARELFDECAKSEDTLLRIAGLAGIARAGGSGAAEALLERLGDETPGVRAAARQGLVDLQDDEAAPAIAFELGCAAPGTRVLLVRILSERGGRDGRHALVDALSDWDEGVRVAAIRALGKLGDPGAGAVAAMTDAASNGTDEELTALEWALNRIPGPYATGVLLKAVSGASLDLRAVLLRALGARGELAATPALVSALESRNEGVRLAAIEGLGRLRDPGTVDPLIAVLGSAEDREREAAEKALAQFTSPESTDTMLAALTAADTPVESRAALLRALAPREDSGLAAAFMHAAKDESEGVAVAALEALARLRHATAAPLFLELAETGPDAVRQAAIRGYLGIAEEREAEDGAAALAIYQQAVGMATGDDEKRQAIRGVGRVGNVASIALIEPFLAHDKLKAAAAEAIVPLADKLRDAGDEERATALYRKAAETSSDRRVVRDAAKRLRELGVELDLAADRGCLVHWWALGPFPGREKATKTDPFPTDQPIDLAKPVAVGETERNWKYWPVDDPLGMLDFETAVARMDNCGAYAYAEVQSDAEQDVLLKIGSDDSVFVWLNGELVHAWDGNRGWGEDQDTAEAHLKAGTNTVLAKVINGGAQWAVSLRLTDRDGKPLKLKQRTE